jgi:hypothetical protein
MTLLSRAPREVYRVYSEEEFFATHAKDLLHCETGAGPLESVVSSGTGERRLRRLAGVAALAGAVGAVGATCAATGPSPARGAGRRAVADSHFATASMPVATGVSASGPIRVGVTARTARRSLSASGSLRRRGEHPHSAPRNDSGRWRPDEDAGQYAALAPRGAPVPVPARPNAAPMDVASANAAPVDIASANAIGTVATTPQPQHAEFGFER